MIDVLPLDEMIAVAAENIESWLPAAPNVVRVRYVGGAAPDRYGEVQGRTEELVELRALIVRKRERREQRAGGDAPVVRWVADYLPVDDVIERGDELRWAGRRFVAVEIGRPELNGLVAFIRATIEEIKS